MKTHKIMLSITSFVFALAILALPIYAEAGAFANCLCTVTPGPSQETSMRCSEEGQGTPRDAAPGPRSIALATDRD